MSERIRPIPRRILALFLEDHESIKIFEALQSNAGDVIPRELDEVRMAVFRADTNSVQALELLERIAQHMELLALTPSHVDCDAGDDAARVADELGLDDLHELPPDEHEETMPYGAMYSNISHTIAVAAINTAYENTTDSSTGLTYLMTFGGAHYLQADRGGVYEINWSMSLTTANPNEKLEGGIMVDGVAQTQGLAHGDTQGATFDIEISGSAFIRVSALQQFSLYVMNHTAANNITIDHVSFTAKLIDRRVVT